MSLFFHLWSKKKRKDLSTSDNYRAIALNSALCKLLDYIIIDYFQKLFQSSDYQFAYKKCFSTSMCTFMVMETVQYYVSRGSNVFATLLDCSKAFDRIRYGKLFDILMSKGLCPLVTRLLVTMYNNIEAKVKWNGIYSDSFKIRNGVKQGGVMSPLLFTLYVDILIKRLLSINVGCYIGSVCSAVFVYADDIILLSPTRKAMQILLDSCESFGTEYDLLFNPDKCEAILFGDGDVPLLLRFCGAQLGAVNRVKHLGHVLTNTKYIFEESSMITDMKCRTNGILCNFRFLSMDSRVKIFNANCSSYYGSQLLDLQNPAVNRLNVAWRVSSRRILGVNPRTHSNLLPSLMKSLPPVTEISGRMFSFFKNGIEHESKIISFYFNNCFVLRESVMYRNMSFISYKTGIDVNNMLYGDTRVNDVKKLLRESHKYEEMWRINIIRELINCKEGVLESSYDRGEIGFVLDFLCIE